MALYYNNGTFLAKSSLKHDDNANIKPLIIANILPIVLF